VSADLPNASEALSPDDTRQLAQSLRTELSQVIVGQEAVIAEVLATMLAGGHCLLRGVPGLAKTLLVKTLADAVDLRFSRIQFTPDLMPSDIIGAEVLDEDRTTGQREVRFLPGPVFANILLADEINRTPPRTQAALLEAMQEGQVTVGGQRHALPAPLFVLATQNPIEQEGTYPLPEAQLDRFMTNVVMTYPSLEEERAILLQTTGVRTAEVRRVADGPTLQRAQRLVREIVAATNIVEAVAHLVRATRPGASSDVPPFVTEWVQWGAGPRAGQALILLAKARAALDGRPAVSLDDVRSMALPVLRHRLLLNFQAEADGIGVDSLVTRLVESVVPR
jgi:MoxR-like ATPase